MNPNSSNQWLPFIEKAGLPVPRTIVVPYSHRDCAAIFDGEESKEFERLVAAVGVAAADIGFPSFIRTDLSSAKHCGTKAFRINNHLEVGNPVSRTLEDNEMKFWLERHGPTAFLVREYLDLPAPFTAFGGLPVSREFRFFADGEHVICRHPYWPAESVKEYIDGTVPGDWAEQLAAMQQLPDDVDVLAGMAVTAASACGGDRWSVDFAQDRSGKWWLIDMARMESSYHWPGCPNGGAT